MNHIQERQNQPEMLVLLKAMRRLYFEEKRGLVIWLAASTAVAVIGSGVLRAAGVVEGYLSLLLVLFAVGEWGVLRWIVKRGEDAALIQELFDTRLFELRWNSAVNQPSAAVIHTAADRYERFTSAKEKAERPLSNWYRYFVTPEMPLPVARVACQRENCYWENKVRPLTVRWTAAGLALLGLLVAAIVIALDWSFRQFFTQALILLLPVFIAGGGYIVEHRKAEAEIQALQAKCDALWEAVQSPSLTADEAAQKSSDLQQEIRHYRAGNPPVLDWIYNQVKKKVEEEERLSK